MAKKTFKQESSAPAMSYISQPQDQPQQETKSKRIQVLIRPSVWERLQKIAYMERHSFNDLLNEICERYAEQEAEKVTRYDEAFGEELHK